MLFIVHKTIYLDFIVVYDNMPKYRKIDKTRSVK
jgi:hypothetical protein